MSIPNKDLDGKLLRLLMDAHDKQNALMVEAKRGRGFDRHLFGLRVAAMTTGSEVGPLVLTKDYICSRPLVNMYLLYLSRCLPYSAIPLTPRAAATATSSSPLQRWVNLKSV